jgi:hypothetical protein
MDDFDFFVALLTPASDLVEGDTGETTQAIFARAGNDVIYGFDPNSNNNDNPKVDVLVGDLFDNSPEEFQIILDIQEGNPLAILDRGKPPSVGADRFVLGDEIQPYYTTFDPVSLVTTDPLGTNQFAVLYDFAPEQDIIQLNGKKDDYEIVEIDGLTVDGIDRPFFGEAIFSLQQGSRDLVAYVVSTPEVDLDLGKDYFEFVGNKPEDKPDEKKIGQLGTTGIDKALGAATDSAGNVYITGSTSGSLGGANQGSSDIWVARYNSNGNQTLLLQPSISTADGETAVAVATDDDGNFYLTGSRGSNGWVAKYNNSGQQQWNKQVALPGAFTTSSFGLDLDQNGNVYVSGLGIKDNPDRETFDFAVEDDSWIAKFDSGGTQQWLTPIDTPFFNENYDLAVDAAGNSYAVGWTQGLVEESDPSRDLLKYDVWISKQNTDGQIEWIQQLGSADEGLEFAWGVDTDSQGNIYVTGWTTGALGTKDKEFEKSESYDVFLAKFAPEIDEQGDSLLWAKQIGSEGDDGMFFSDLHIDAQDNIFLTGYTDDELGKGEKDEKASSAWVGKFDTEGNNDWIQQFGSKESLDYGTDLSADGNGNLYVTGYTEAFLGTNNGVANGAAVDAWLAKLDVEEGKLKEFIGDSDDFVSIGSPSEIFTPDITDQLVVNEQLPEGDDRINPTDGLETTSDGVDNGQIISNLTNPFDPRAENSFGSALVEALGEDSIPSSEEVGDLKIEGTDGDDNLFGDIGNDEIEGKKGNDNLFGNAGDDKLEGKDGNDTIIGGTGNDELKGGKGIDEIIGVDTINGVAGLGQGEIDKLKGEDDSDRFVLGDSTQPYYVGQGNLDYGLIDDFELDESDTIQLYGNADDYNLETNVPNLPKGTAIFLGTDREELIGVVKNVEGLTLDDTSVFGFV